MNGLIGNIFSMQQLAPNSKSMSWGRSAPLLFSVMMTVILNGIGLISAKPASAAEDTGIEARPLQPTDDDMNFVVEVVNRVEPAVVKIYTTGTATVGIPDILVDLYARLFPDGPPLPEPEERVVRGNGSGFIVTADGLIFTNAHVVDNADEVVVQFDDGTTLEGEVLGEDAITDIAVVRVEAENLPTVELGDSDQLMAGQWAIAMGSPLGLDRTVTIGVVSTTERAARDIGAPDMRVDFIQTDAAINPGNSGGPLLNARGQVIGVNTAILRRTQGLGFAVPINLAEEIAEELIAYGRVEHPYLGILMTRLTPELRQQLNEDPEDSFQIEVDEGVLVTHISPNSPAAAGGLQVGDVILEMNGQVITDVGQVQQIVEEGRVGDPITMMVKRGEQSLELNATLQPLPIAAP